MELSKQQMWKIKVEIKKKQTSIFHLLSHLKENKNLADDSQ